MKLPKRISNILKQKQDYINQQRDLLSNTTIKYQSKLFNDIIAELIPKLDIKDGVIQETANNYKLLSTLDKIYKGVHTAFASTVLDQVLTTTKVLSKQSKTYFELLLGENLPSIFEKVIEKTNKLMNSYIGIGEERLVRAGFLESFLNDNKIGTDLKQLSAKAVTANTDIKEFTQTLKDKLIGVEKVSIQNGKKVITQTGALEKQINDYVIDLYQTYDQAYNKTIGNELGLRYFIYQGGLVDDSRDFCVSHNNKVWSIEEAQSWKEWVPADGDYPAGYEVKAKDIYSVPSYLGYPGYSPLVNLGGYRCRHMLGWITDDIAFGMRPELKE